MPEKKTTKQKILSIGILIANRYTITQYLGSGYWGSVYKAADEFGRHYSVKIFLKNHIKRYFDIEDFKGQLFNTSKLLLNTQSNSLLIPYDVGEDADLFFIVNDYIEGLSLGSKIAKDGVLNPKQALIIFSEILSALHALHSVKTIHGDLNTHDIFISAPRFSSPYPDFFEVKIESRGTSRGTSLSNQIT